MGNNLATLPGRTANHKLKEQFLVLLEEESVDFERELRAKWIDMIRGNGECW